MSSPSHNLFPGSTSISRPRRLHGLDWLRAGAALLVVALHAGIAYLVVPMPGLAWATHDPVGHPLVDAGTWWIDSFVMPLFVMLGGFLAAQILKKKGPSAFLRHRTQRLLGPLLFACVAILPLDLYAWLLSWAAQGWIPLKKLRSLKVDSPLGDHLWGVSHLWFLEYLWTFCLIAWGVHKLTDWWPRRNVAFDKDVTPSSRPSMQLLRTLVVPSLMGLSTIALWCNPQLVIGFRHAWWPLPANLCFYAAWFALGWVIFAKSETPRPQMTLMTSPDDRTVKVPHIKHVDLPIVAAEWRVAAAVVVFPILLPLIHQQARGLTTGSERLVLAALFVLHAWLIVTGLFGVCVRWLDREPPAFVKYIAEASFWIYLIHHPVVGLAQADLAPLALAVEVKFAAVFAVALAFSLLTYHGVVRQTWVGALLNGRRNLRPEPGKRADVRPIRRPEESPLRKSA